MESRIAMSQRERDVLKVMSVVRKGERTQREAARLLGLSERQVRRIQRRLESEGDAAVVHRLRGRPSNRRLDSELRERAVAIYRAELSDFGPTLASEQLAKRKTSVSPDTLRRWLLTAGLWARKRQRAKHRSRRERRACFGELIQMDTSIHDWLEGRCREPIVLVAMIDDATGQVLARFYRGETVEAHFDLLGRWLKRYGRAVSLYTDHDSIFESESKGEKTRGATQFSRALQQLGVELILAGSPQAKGRVERLFRTLQDRWVKALRLARVRTLEAANALVDRKLLPEFNRRFVQKATSPNDAHRPLGPSHHVSAILSVQSHRRVLNDYTIRFRNRLYQLEPPAWPGLRGGRVMLEERLDGTLAIRFGERYLKYHEIVGREEGPSDGGSRSLSQERIPVLSPTNGRHGVKATDRAGKPTRSGTVYPAAGRSGRTPAEPYPPRDSREVTRKVPYRPQADHPWRRRFLNL
jgi:transposase